MDVNKIRKNILLVPFLLIISIVYRFVTDIRNFLYDHELFKVHKFNVPVISVGNITTGGTGKTPFIIYLIEKLSNKYNNVTVVSRGYGRESKGLQVVSDGKGNIATAEIGGDEPVLIAIKFPNTPVIVSENRKKGIETAIDKFGSDLILLDDAFQHRTVNRNCDIVLVNANYPIIKEKLLPLGNLRESKNHLNRADIVLLTKIDKQNDLQDQIDYQNKFSTELFLSKYSNSIFTKSDSNAQKITFDLKETAIIGFSGIAYPENFKLDLEKQGVILKDFLSFKDHKKYNKHDIAKIVTNAENNDCRNIVTTEKDYVKLNIKDFEKYNLFVLSVKVEVEKEEIFLKKLQDCIDSKS